MSLSWLAEYGGAPTALGEAVAFFPSEDFDVVPDLVEERQSPECDGRTYRSIVSYGRGLSAGLLTFSGLTGPEPVLQLTASCAGPYGCVYNYQTGLDFFAPSTLVSVSAVGDEVPGFGGVSLLPPEALMLKSPDFAAAVSADDLGFAAGSPFVVSWVPVGSGTTIHVYLASRSDVTPITEITCDAVDDGDLEVPPELTALFDGLTLEALLVQRTATVVSQGISLTIRTGSIVFFL